MPRVLIRTRDLIAACNAAQLLEAWLNPGVLAWRVGQIGAALLPHAEPLQKMAEKLLDAHVELDALTGKRKLVEVFDDAYIADPAAENGQRKVSQVVGKELVYRDRVAYDAAASAMESEDIVVDVPKLLTEDHCKALEKERVKQHPTDPQSGRPLPSPSFTSLACVIEGTARLAPTGA